MTSLRRLKQRRIARFGGLALALAALASCTLFGSRDVEQCTKNSDCARSPLQPAICSGGLCVRGAAVDTGVDAPADVVVQQSCSVTTDCASPNLCVSGVCRSLIDPNNSESGCGLIYPEGEKYRQDPDVLFVGVYVATGPNVGTELSMAPVRLAIDEINQSGVRIVAVLCDKLKKQPGLALDHIASLQIPVLLGQFESDTLASLVAKGVDKNVLVWSTLGNDQLGPLETLDAGALFLDRLGTLAPALATATSQRVAQRDAGDSKIVVLSGGPAQDVTELKQQALATSADAGVPVTTFDSPLSSANQQAVREMHPAIIIGLGGDEIAQDIEKLEGDESYTPPRANYIVASRTKFNASSFTNIVTLQGGPSLSDFPRRFLGVDFGGDRAKHAAFAQRLGSAVKPGARSFDLLYDAIYVAALSAVAPRAAGAGKPKAPFTREDLVRGFVAIHGGDASQPIDVGREGSQSFIAGATTISGGQSIRFNGVTGAWTFDPTLPHRRTNMGSSFFCLSSDGLVHHYVSEANLTTECAFR